MATVRPFRGLRYDPKAGELQDLVAPPYDVVSPEQREALAAKNPHNVVRLTLPEQQAEDRSKFVKYARSAAQLEEWRREGVLRLEESPAFYRYKQTFTVPGTATAISRTKIVTTIKVEPYSRGVVLPHEQTFPKHKEDRMRILEATRSHLECIFGLIEDDDQSVHGMVAGAPASPIADFLTAEDGIRHVLDRIDDPLTCAAISEAIGPKKVWIADGHHRYETALAFRENLGPRDGLIAEDFMMMALCSITDPGLVLLPTHRILKTLSVDAGELEARLKTHFAVEHAPNAELAARIAKVPGRAFGVALPGGTGLVASTADVEALASHIEGPGGSALKQLDVSVLHAFIFAKLLGLTGHDFFGYTRDEREAVEAVEHGSPASFLMNPPSVQDMRDVAAAGDFMPQKSTYYYPKLLSGLVLWSLKDFEP
jgi:uncharacterized protein (DUF1015 family)